MKKILLLAYTLTIAPAMLVAMMADPIPSPSCTYSHGTSSPGAGPGIFRIIEHHTPGTSNCCDNYSAQVRSHLPTSMMLRIRLEDDQGSPITYSAVHGSPSTFDMSVPSTDNCGVTYTFTLEAQDSRGWFEPEDTGGVPFITITCSKDACSLE